MCVMSSEQIRMLRPVCLELAKYCGTAGFGQFTSQHAVQEAQQAAWRLYTGTSRDPSLGRLCSVPVGPCDMMRSVF